MIVAYVSGHGFGHATRTAEVIRELRRAHPASSCVIVTSAPSFLFSETVREEIEVRPLDCDVGLVQDGALAIDEQASIARFKVFHAGWESIVDQEARWLRSVAASVVFGDIPPLAFEAAARADVPSLALANFSWDWIYRHLARKRPEMNEMAEWASAAYRKTGLLMRLPFAGDLSVFPRSVDIPLVARRPKADRGAVRRWLGVGEEPLVLISFGGHGISRLAPAAFAPLTEYRFLFVDEGRPLPSNAIGRSRAELSTRGLSYVDLVGAADVIITKPGYGIVTDAIGARCRMIYTNRGDFPEYPILAREMTAFLPNEFVSNEELISGSIGSALKRVLARRFPLEPRLNGASEAARRIIGSARELSDS